MDDRQLANDLVDRLFTKMDLNGDGRISISEMTHVLLGLGIEGASAIAQATMAKGDTDHSGDLDRDEFAAILSDLESSGPEHGFKLLFAAFDTNSDGHIDDAELERLFLFLDVPLSPTERRALFQRVDADGNGVLTAREVLAALTLLQEV